MDTLSNALVSIKNASMRAKDKVEVKYSKIVESVLKVLKNEGYISNYKVVKNDKENKQFIRITLKYTSNKVPMFSGFKRMSKSSRRMYRSYEEFPRIKNAYGINIISTSKGVMTDREAKKEKVGGEVLCQIW